MILVISFNFTNYATKAYLDEILLHVALTFDKAWWKCTANYTCLLHFYP